jgi:twitching motility protein PilT
MDHILSKMLESHSNVSDLNFTPGKPLQVESSGELVPVHMEPEFNLLTPFQTEAFALNLIHGDRRLTETLLKEGSCDLSYALGDKARFRVNIFSRSGKYAIVLRKLETQIPTVRQLNLPRAFDKMVHEKNGIIFVTGSTGSGKSTSLAALLDEFNDTRSVHIITLEDPIEFQHPQKKATFNQRELGSDFDTFASGLRANRIVGMFSSEEEKQIRIRLADTVRWIVCQRLLPKTGGGRVAAFEIMGNNLRIKDAITNGESEDKTFYQIIKDGTAFGMTTFDDFILGLYQRGLITEDIAMGYASKKAVVGRGMDSIKSARGEKTTEIENLELDHNYEGA